MALCFEKEPKYRFLGLRLGTRYVRTLTPSSERVVFKETIERDNRYGKCARISNDGKQLVIYGFGQNSEIETKRIPIEDIERYKELKRKIVLV